MTDKDKTRTHINCSPFLPCRRILSQPRRHVIPAHLSAFNLCWRIDIPHHPVIRRLSHPEHFNRERLRARHTPTIETPLLDPSHAFKELLRGCKGNIDAPCTSLERAMVQGGADTCGEEVAGGVVESLTGERQGWVAWVGGVGCFRNVHACAGLDERVEAAEVGPRAFTAPGGEIGADDVRVDLDQLLGRETLGR